MFSSPIAKRCDDLHKVAQLTLNLWLFFKREISIWTLIGKVAPVRFWILVNKRDSQTSFQPSTLTNRPL